MNRFDRIFARKTVFALAGAAAIFTGPALNAAPPVDLVVGSDGVEWIPAAVTGKGSYTLRVATPGGDVITYDFGNGENPYYIADAGDGGYKYELVWNPSPNAQPKAVGSKSGEEDENGRSGSDNPGTAGGPGGLLNSGYFTVADGSVVDPDAVE